MAYLPNIPAANDVISQSQADIQGNFQAINTFVNVNHVDFASADAGKHKFIQFPGQGSNPATAAGEVAVYCRTSTVTAVPELFYRRASNGTVIEASASILSTTPAPANNSAGWTWLPSGLLLKWGNGTANGSATVAFPVAANIPVFTQVVSVQITNYAAGAVDTDTFTRLVSFNNLGVTVYGSARSTTGAVATTFQYLAIGY